MHVFSDRDEAPFFIITNLRKSFDSVAVICYHTLA